MLRCDFCAFLGGFLGFLGFGLVVELVGCNPYLGNRLNRPCSM